RYVSPRLYFTLDYLFFPQKSVGNPPAITRARHPAASLRGERIRLRPRRRPMRLRIAREEPPELAPQAQNHVTSTGPQDSPWRSIT
ncbi:MAG: hypothetical protein ACRC0L_02600, partial [Angustibacter sp.]